MASFFFIFIIVFLSITGEITLSQTGIFIPITAISIYYIATNLNVVISIFCSVGAGVIIDAYFYRSVTFSPFIFLTIVALAHFWSKNTQGKLPILNIIPRIFIPLLCTLPFFIYKNIQYRLTGESLLDYLTSTSITIIISAFLLPLLTIVFDYFKDQLDLPFFKKDTKSGARNWK